MMKRYKFLILVLILIGVFAAQSCGPVVISSRPDVPPPPWFYPNRVEVVRYVYFPDFNIYYDIHLRNYIYFENNAWIIVTVLPPRYSYINFNRARYVRIRGFRGDNIQSYHSTNRYYHGSRSTRSRTETRSRRSSTRSRSTTTRSRSSRSSSATKSRSRDSIQ